MERQEMANNRMYLLHRPSRKAVLLASRMAREWGGGPHDLQDQLYKLFEKADEYAEGQDDFCIALEDGTYASLAVDICNSGCTVHMPASPNSLREIRALHRTSKKTKTATEVYYADSAPAKRIEWLSQLADRVRKLETEVKALRESLKGDRREARNDRVDASVGTG